MNTKRELMRYVSKNYNIRLEEDDPVLYMMDMVLTIIDDRHTDTLSAISAAEKSLPYMLEIKRQEIDNTAMKFLNAGEILHQEQKSKLEMIELGSTKRLMKHSDELVDSILFRLNSGMESKIENTLHSSSQSIEKLASAMKTQYTQDVKNRNKEQWFYIGCGFLSGLFGSLVFFAMLLFTDLI